MRPWLPDFSASLIRRSNTSRAVFGVSLDRALNATMVGWLPLESLAKKISKVISSGVRLVVVCVLLLGMGGGGIHGFLMVVSGEVLVVSGGWWR